MAGCGLARTAPARSPVSADRVRGSAPLGWAPVGRSAGRDRGSCPCPVGVRFGLRTDLSESGSGPGPGDRFVLGRTVGGPGPAFVKGGDRAAGCQPLRWPKRSAGRRAAQQAADLDAECEVRAMWPLRQSARRDLPGIALVAADEDPCVGGDEDLAPVAGLDREQLFGRQVPGGPPAEPLRAAVRCHGSRTRSRRSRRRRCGVWRRGWRCWLAPAPPSSPCTTDVIDPARAFNRRAWCSGPRRAGGLLGSVLLSQSVRRRRVGRGVGAASGA
ncbi:hypothetical protein FraEuI1c_0913 [Pseudofrankia inefficax]|uniref:Uncharacterized protein n=1 Tax=Pseudofrankia inefficax (strain DSM 45817 / CECT 9037 / DDB 130130 / EuI1c) TaxID=298654 RepID=E3IXH0_PSEI1|nr:hypothetical protein FraEuI1c_0913 [Pseudofrankia inefficax]